MSKISINDVEYDTDLMTEDALANLKSIQFVDGEMAKLKSQIAVLSTARLAYAAALQQGLSETTDASGPDDP